MYLSGGFAYRTGVVQLLPGNQTVNCERFANELSSIHEEADTRVALHTGFYARMECTDVIVEANDTDIVVILLQSFKTIEKQSHATPNVLVRLRDKVISITELANRLPPSLVNSIAFLHCFTGCDTVSFIFSKGKKTILRAAVPWLPRISALTEQILEQIDRVVELEEDIMKLCCEILIASYRKSEEYLCLNDLHLYLFPRGKTLKSLPPTDDSFALHVKRCIYQWSIMLQFLMRRPSYLSSLDFGWEMKDR